MLGDDVFFQDEPEVPIRVLFFRLSELKRKVAATELQMRQIEGSDDIRDCAETLGIEKSLDPNFGAEDVARYLTGAMEELHILLGCLSAEFEPVGRSLALYRAHGQITFDLLIYEFEKEQLLVIRDENGDKNAFVIEKAEFQDNHIPYSFSLSGHGWKWNGTCYMKDMRSIHIEEFPGTRGLSSLPFSHLEPDMKVELEHRGELYTRYAPGIQYIHNHGKGKVIVKSIHEIIRYLPSGRAMIDIRNRAPPELDTDSWVVEARPRKKASHKEEQTHMTLPSDLLYLLPPTVQGFSLASKEFGRIRVVDVGPVKFDENAWDHLVLDPDSKTLIRSLVEVTQSSNSATELITDVITGKGGGLVGVLHGSPGTGKTLTAEAVAEHLRRPLYMVSAGELSLDAPTLEKEFKGILQRATDWDAVLLIDEADVFLEQRSNHELHRNSIVSVTLRLLEYHRGVMFLTTNRISAFDQAFLSRFSIAIRYPDLDFDKRRVIWQRFLALAGITQQEEEGKPYVSAEDIDRLAARPFNGRSVKNLVRTAQALALAENVPLAIRHIEVVASVSEKFLADFADMKSGAAPVGTVKEG